jgi:hypothetical protein
MKAWKAVIAFLLSAVALAIAWRVYGAHTNLAAWQRHASPGVLSRAHTDLQDNCAACHTPVGGPADAKCIGCHANNTALLQRQPTAFHAEIGSCAQCHIEHRGADASLMGMDHGALSRAGLRRVDEIVGKNKMDMRNDLLRWVNANVSRTSRISRYPAVSPLEAILNCSSCHATKDTHSGLFGTECASCHGTAKWAIDQFRHPSANSFDCAQCHQAPPSHYMMHFEMVSKKIAGQSDAQVAQCCGVAQVSQCYRCHQTTSWNDIKGVGWYKHH